MSAREHLKLQSVIKAVLLYVASVANMVYVSCCILHECVVLYCILL